MKWSSFVMGGLTGMAAAVFLSRRRPEWISLAGSAASEMMTGKFMRKKNAAIPKPAQASAKGSAEAWDQIHAVVESDPELNQEVEKMLQDNKAH
ncbi:hypothetical protein [Paenibacillus sp. GCM10027626]|uniref:hypothetical protein n=1 Tax=Paenibacillus sp. GCM10027626 TaxID=3273411 RepID=UPI003640C417